MKETYNQHIINKTTNKRMKEIEDSIEDLENINRKSEI